MQSNFVFEAHAVRQPRPRCFGRGPRRSIRRFEMPERAAEVLMYLALGLGMVAFLFHLIATTHHKERKGWSARHGLSMFDAEPYTNYFRKRALGF